jgi:hypothetical protein
VNFFDVSAFLAAYGAEDLSADINGDGMWNLTDVSAFVNENTALDGNELE